MTIPQTREHFRIFPATLLTPGWPMGDSVGPKLIAKKRL